MIANLIVLAFVLGLAFMWSTQGLFSALLHLAMTILAGTLAFAFWEPLVVGLLLDRMPEYAWGVGLLSLFGVILIVLRVIADRVVPGNLDQPYLANMIGGGVLGAISGVLTAGIVIISLQFIAGLPMGYQPYKVVSNGQVERDQSLWIPADRIAASWFTALSSGSLSPGFSSISLATHHPNLAEEASLFSATAREHARQTIRPGSVEIKRRMTLSPADAPEALGIGSGKLGLVVGVDVKVSDHAGDSDGVFTASVAQLSLISRDDAGKTHVHQPTGWVYHTAKKLTYGKFATAADFVRSKSAAEVKFDLVFNLPEDEQPRFLRIKNLRIALPEDDNQPEEAILKWKTQTRWAEPKVDDVPAEVDPGLSDPQGVGAGMAGVEVIVSNALPYTLNSNTIKSDCTNVRFEDVDERGDKRRHLVSATGSVLKDTTRVQGLLAVDTIAHSDGERIVRVKLTAAKAKSLLGKIAQLAGQTAPPVLEDSDGDSVPAFGYIVASSGQQTLAIDPATTVRGLAAIDQNLLADGVDLYLYFKVSRGVTITEFSFGGSTGKQTLNLPIH